jgi:hypothetical protein
MGAWYIRIIGKRRKDVDLNLIVQAVIALGEQLREEERRVIDQDNRQADTDTTTDTDTESVS